MVNVKNKTMQCRDLFAVAMTKARDGSRDAACRVIKHNTHRRYSGQADLQPA